jgi:DNA-directed RNA polymerase subunit RPC12/RpoP
MLQPRPRHHRHREQEQAMTTPAAVTGPINFKCPTCGNVLSASPVLAGQKVACPHCTQRLQVPGLPSPPAPMPTNKTVLGELEGRVQPARMQPLALPADNYDYLPPETRRPRRYAPPPNEPERSSTLASLSLACGIGNLFLCPPLLGPLAILFGVISLCLPREQDAKASAIGGIVCGIVGLIVSGLIFIVLMQAQTPRRF